MINQNYYNQLLRQIGQVKEENPYPFIVYGQVYVDSLEQLLIDLRIKPICTIDDDIRKQGRSTDRGDYVTTLDRFHEQNPDIDYNVIIPIAYYTTVCAKLMNSIYPPKKIIYIDTYFLENDTSKEIQDSYHEYIKNLNLFEDEVSRVHYKKVLDYRIDGNLSSLLNIGINSKSKYFEPNIMKLGSHEILFDAGAYDGNSIEAFLRFTEGQYSKIYAAEPGVTQMMEMKNRLKIYGDIEYFQIALYDHKRELKFSKDGSPMSKIDEKGKLIVHADTIDNVLQGRPITLLKMDIEGAELPALEGARDTINAWHPKLAISVYHSAYDLLNIPILLKNVSEGGKFILDIIVKEWLNLFVMLLRRIKLNENN